MKRVSTLFLRISIAVMGLGVLGLCALILPSIYREWGKGTPYGIYNRFSVMVALSITAVSFFIALIHAWKLLDLIDKSKTFSAKAIRALRNIQYSAALITILYAGALPLVYFIADNEDAPGVMVIGLLLTGTPLVIAVFAAVMQGVLQNAIDIKSENDLTV